MKLKAENISFKYPSAEKYIIKDIDLELDNKKIIGLIGDSGSGKSTFCKILSGYITKYKGSVTLDGGIIGNGVVNFENGTSLVAKLNKTVILADSVIFNGNNTIKFIITDNLSNNNYDFITATTLFAGIENVTLVDNPIYNLNLTNEGKINVSLKTADEIVDSVDKPITKQEAESIAAIVTSNGNTTEIGNTIADAISTAMQSGDFEKAIKGAQELAPTTSQQVIGVASSVNNLLSIQVFILTLEVSKYLLTSSISGVAIKAAPVGVGALLSATKSLIVKSISCPTPLIIGILLLYIALATISSLNAHKSSIEPPPRPRMIVSISSKVFASSIILTIFGAASAP